MKDLTIKQLEFYESINDFFGIIYNYNSNLLKKCNRNGKCNYVEIFDFYITSNANSFLKNVYLGFISSQTIFFNIRCIIEGLALKYAFKNGYFNNFNFELLQNQAPIIEYNQYKEFKKMFPILAIPNDIKISYNKAKDFFYKNLSNLRNKDIDNILHSQIPFACDCKLSYKKIIKDILGEEMEKTYAFLSSIIHPNSNYKKDVSYYEKIIVLTFKYLKIEYKNKKKKNTDLKAQNYIVKLSPDCKRFESIINELSKNFNTISDAFKKEFNENYVSDTFTDLSYIYRELASDLVFGFVEQVKSKYKIIIELLASFHYVYIESDYVNQLYKLLTYNEFISLSKIDNDSNYQENLNNAYLVYKEIYENGVDYDTFANKFSNKLGYTIDEKGNVKTYTKLVNDFFKYFKQENDKIPLSKILRLNYVESQMLSHANGYMWFANSGAWGDVNNIFANLNIVFSTVCYEMQLIFKDYYNQSKKYQYKKISNLFKRTCQYIDNIQLEMIEVLNKRNGIIAQ